MPIAEANGGIANNREGNLVRRLAHHKLSRRCYSIGNRSERDLDSSAEKVDASSEVFDWFETCTADRKARRPQPHRAHSTIDNYDSHIFSRPSCLRRQQRHSTRHAFDSWLEPWKTVLEWCLRVSLGST